MSDDLTHDQAFVKVVMEENLDSIYVQEAGTAVITTDNCTSQYKSVQHFHDLQSVATKYKIKII